MLIMTAKLVGKRVRLEGISYYGETLEQAIQKRINRRDDDPPAIINDEIKEIFIQASYNFLYPEEMGMRLGGN